MRASSLLFVAAATASPQISVQVSVSASASASTVVVDAYAPTSVVCPSGSLIRPATSINTNEAAYVAARLPLAQAALKTFLTNAFANYSVTLPATKKLPMLGFTSSGGGFRALLCAAGVHQAFDARDGSGLSGMAGLYQALTYEAGLSGGAWLLSSIAANNWPTITSLKTGLWETTFEEGLVVSGGLNNVAVVADLAAKEAAGFQDTLVDAWGRLLSQELLYGTDGGVADRLSGLASLSNFTSYQVPFPIFTAIGVYVASGQSYGEYPADNSTQYEFTPYEYGSWDAGVSSFAQSKYMGSTIVNGTAGPCYENYDNQGYILGTSSNIFGAFGGTVDGTTLAEEEADFGAVFTTADTILTQATNDTDDIFFGLYPNPFEGYARAYKVAADKNLTLVDGGFSNQNNPIWPMLHRPELDVLFVSDNSADTDDNFPNGTEIYVTYQQAVAQGLTRMPVIPDVATFVGEGLNKRPVFFGCDNSSLLTIIYFSNVNYTFPSNEPTSKLEYNMTETIDMISNGVLIGSYNGSATFPTCVACAVLKKTAAKLPSECTECFAEFCYN